MKRALALGTAIGGALALTACMPPHPHAHGPLRVISRLDCPNEQGDLKIVSQGGDGLSCVYNDSEGAVVDVSLVKLNGADPQTVLAPIEPALEAEMPASSTLTASKHVPGDHDNVDIDVPGVHIHADENGGAKVQTPGATVTASANGGAEVRGKGVNINANDAGAQIRVNDSGPGVRSIFLLVADNPGPHGYRFVGYQARGPASGPLVVVQAKGKQGDHDDLDHDVKRLLDRNVGA